MITVQRKQCLKSENLFKPIISTIVSGYYKYFHRIFQIQTGPQTEIYATQKFIQYFIKFSMSYHNFVKTNEHFFCRKVECIIFM